MTGESGPLAQQAQQSTDNVGESWSASGTIAALDEFGMTLDLADGAQVYVELGPPTYWQAQDVVLAAGDVLTVDGFFNGEQVHAGTVTTTDGAQLALRTPEGQPLWSGGASSNNGNDTGESQVTAEEWVTLSGVVLASTNGSVTMRTDDGQDLILQLGQPAFQTTQNVTLAVNDEIAALGFWQGEQFQVGEITNVATGERLMLRDPNGRPLWAGPGRNGNAEGNTATNGSRGQGRATVDGSGVNSGGGQGQANVTGGSGNSNSNGRSGANGNGNGNGNSDSNGNGYGGSGNPNSNGNNGNGNSGQGQAIYQVDQNSQAALAPESQAQSQPQTVAVVADQWETLTGQVQAVEALTITLQSSAPSQAVISAQINVNVRSGPGTGYAIVTTAPSGAVVQIVDQNDTGDWQNVQLADGSMGWIATDLLTVEDALLQTLGSATVRLGQMDFWTAQGINFTVGDQVEVDGYWIDGQFEAGTITFVANGTQLQVRDESGQLLWTDTTITSAQGA